MQFQTPYHIGVGDYVSYRNRLYQVLINYIKGETDKTGYTPKSNRTILIDNDDSRVTCHNFLELRKVEA